MIKLMIIFYGLCLLLTSCASRSLGPIDSQNYIDILASSISTSPSDILYNARSSWFTKYLRTTGYTGGLYYGADIGVAPEGILTITTSKVMFLVWSEEKKLYGHLFALPISAIRSVNTYDGDLTIGILTKDNRFYLLQVLASGRNKKEEHKKIQDILRKSYNQ